MAENPSALTWSLTVDSSHGSSYCERTADAAGRLRLSDSGSVNASLQSL
jgi:hypothetical protein